MAEAEGAEGSAGAGAAASPRPADRTEGEFGAIPGNVTCDPDSRCLALRTAAPSAQKPKRQGAGSKVLSAIKAARPTRTPVPLHDVISEYVRSESRKVARRLAAASKSSSGSPPDRTMTYCADEVSDGRESDERPQAGEAHASVGSRTPVLCYRSQPTAMAEADDAGVGAAGPESQEIQVSKSLRVLWHPRGAPNYTASEVPASDEFIAALDASGGFSLFSLSHELPAADLRGRGFETLQRTLRLVKRPSEKKKNGEKHQVEQYSSLLTQAVLLDMGVDYQQEIPLAEGRCDLAVTRGTFTVLIEVKAIEYNEVHMMCMQLPQLFVYMAGFAESHRDTCMLTCLLSTGERYMVVHYEAGAFHISPHPIEVVERGSLNWDGLAVVVGCILAGLKGHSIIRACGVRPPISFEEWVAPDRVLP